MEELLPEVGSGALEEGIETVAVSGHCGVGTRVVETIGRPWDGLAFMGYICL